MEVSTVFAVVYLAIIAGTAIYFIIEHRRKSRG